MSLRTSTAWLLLKETYREWSRDNALRHGAALSYYAVFSLPPLLFLVVAISGLAFGEEAARGQLLSHAQRLIGERGAQAIRIVLEHTGGERTSIIATIVGAAFLLAGATAVFAELQDSLNTLWGIREKPGRAILAVLRTRLLSFAMVAGIGLFMLILLAAGAVVSAMGGLLGGIWQVPPDMVAALQALNFVVSFVAVTVLFAMIYKFLPHARVAWRDVWLGAAAAATLFTIGKFVIHMYLGSSRIVSAYRAAGSLIVLFVWIYFSAQILFLGAEFTQVYARLRGREIEPSRHAERIAGRPEQGLEREAVGEDSAA
jgi:membrane protein